MNVSSAGAGIDPKAEAFYRDALALLHRSKIPFLVAGTFAVNHHTGLGRQTKDLDIFCKAGDFPKILAFFREHGYKSEVTDERWLAKVRKSRFYFDVIFNSTTAVTPVGDAWWQGAPQVPVFGSKVRVLPPTELLWSKVFVQDRYKYDGSDIAHIILAKSGEIDWKRLLNYMEQYWEVLLMHVLNFRFIYPSERLKIPKWLFDELLERLRQQSSMPTTGVKVCRGRLFSRSDYHKDVTEWGFADVVGPEGEKK